MAKLDKRDSRVYNTHRVPRRQWNKWSLVAHHVFNKTYEEMVRMGPAVCAPQMKAEVTEKDWNTISWNAAFTAAGITTRGEFLLFDRILKIMKDKNIDRELLDT